MIDMPIIYMRDYNEKVFKERLSRVTDKERNVFAACMVSLNEADAMVCGLTRSYAAS